MHFPARVFVGAVAIVTLVLSTVFTVARTEAQRAANTSATRALEQSADLVAQLLAGRGRSLAGGARVFVQGPYFRTLVAESRRDDILDQTFEAAEQLDASWVFITDATGMLVAKSDEPSASGDQLANVALISGALRGQIMTGFGGSGDSALFQATAVPVAAPGGSPFGVLVATRLLDSAMAADISAATGSELVFYVRTADGAAHVAASTMVRDSSLRAAVRRRASGQAPLRLDGQEWITHATALNTAGGTEVGGYLVLRRADVEVLAITALRRALVMAGALGLLLAVVTAIVAHRVVASPARRLANEVRALGREPKRTLAETRAAVDASRLSESEPFIALSREISVLRSDLRDRSVLRELLSAEVNSLVMATKATRTPEQPEVSGLPNTLLWKRNREPRSLSLPVSRHVGSETTSLAPGTLVARRYRIDAVLGERDRSALFRAFDVDCEEPVVLKVFRQERLFLDENARALLAADVAKAGRVVHPQVASVRDIGDAHGAPFVTSELVPGVSLATILAQRGALPARAVSALARQLLRGLAAAHAQGVIHGDITPREIRVTPGGLVKLTGFGIAHALRDAAQRAQSAQRAGDAELTGRLAGATVGTPQYLAPEQLLGAPAIFASDLYALGVVLAECLGGHCLHRHDMPVRLIGARLGAERAAALQTERTTWRSPLDSLLGSMTENDLARRADSAAHLLDRLDRLDASSDSVE